MAESSEKSWQARISEATDKLAQSFVESISYDRRMYKYDIAGSIAHATMLVGHNLISAQERDEIIKALKEIEAEIDRDGDNWPGFKPELEDIHMCIEAALIERIGDPGRKLHTGRSRNDQVATDLALWLQEASHKLEESLDLLVNAFGALAVRSADVVMPSFTHLQRAQPIAAGAEALAWAQFFLEDRWRIRVLPNISTSSEMPLGSGAIAGTSLPINAEHTRKAFGYIRENTPDAMERFRTVPISSIERTASRDSACDLLYCCAMIAQHLSRWAEQWIIYSTTEFSFIKIADKYTTGSSMMPQKRNPDMLELIRGRCGNVYGDLFALMTILKGLPIGYNRDLQEDKRIVFRAYDTVSSCLTMAAAIVASASFVKENIEPTLERGFLDATSLAEYFVTKGVPFRTAHQIVGSLVARCEKEGKTSLSQLSLDDFKKACDKSEANVFEALGAKNVVKRYRSAGAAGGKPFEDQLKAWKERLGM